MQGITARVRYAKSGLARFIGHLDTARALLRAVRRTGMEALYTQGFTPRLSLSFGPPLPLGLTSECEFMDIKLARRHNPETLKEKLQSQFADGFAVFEVEVLGDSPSPLQAAFWATEYEVTLPGERSGVGGQGLVLAEPDSVNSSRLPRLNESPAESGPARPARHSAIVDLFWRNRETGERVLSVILRHDVPGGSRIREVVQRLLGIEEAEITWLRIHKKKVYRRGEKPIPSVSDSGLGVSDCATDSRFRNPQSAIQLNDLSHQQ